ncbi:NAD/NADP octopine/nopaline dehydrogenase family protein [Chloroflexota bacterium]
MLEKPIAILGGGNGGHCMAADLTLAGYQVNFYEHPDFADGFRATLETRKVELGGIGRQGRADISLVTTDMAQAIEDADLINIVLPAQGHDLFFNEMIPHLRDGQTVVVWAGDFGSLRLYQLLKEQGRKIQVTIYEASTLPYGTRLVAPARVDLLLVAPRILISALPAKNTDKDLEELRILYPCLVTGQNVLATAFNNPNTIIHPPGSLLNTGRIQYSRGEFYMYREGITEAVARVIRTVFDEVSVLAKVLGVEMIQYEKRDFQTTGSIMGVSFQAPVDTLGVLASIKGPHTVYDRYITEDLPFGLVPIVELGRKVGVATPVVEAIVNIGVVVCHDNFWEAGRTLATLGLADLSKEEILQLVEG